MTAADAPFEAFPYPVRDPAQETKRLRTGSPSHPLEIDHYLFKGQRDWSKPIRILVAGGRTGDGLIQMAQVLSAAKKPYEITYLDPSRSAREIAEARAEARGLTGVTFKTGSLLEARKFGRFDYIECSSGIAELPKPQPGFSALAKALKRHGGIGLVVDAPFGRLGVAQLQEVFQALPEGPPDLQLSKARAIFRRLPEGHPVKRNPHLRDQLQSDAGFYDLLLRLKGHSFTIRELFSALRGARLAYVGSPQSFLYDPRSLLGDDAILRGMDQLSEMELAEKLRGTIRSHVVYVARVAKGHMAHPSPQAVPHLRGVTGPRLAEEAAKSGIIPVTIAGEKIEIPVSGITARALAAINGRSSLSQVADTLRMDWDGFEDAWQPLSDSLTAHGLLYYSRILC